MLHLKKIGKSSLYLIIHSYNYFLQVPTETFQSVTESGLDVEYQVPTSSQRDHEEDTDAVIVVESDDDGDGPDEGEGADDDPDDPDTEEGYDMEVNYGVC